MKHPDTTATKLTPQQKRSGLAAWLGWLFDGLDMHLYTLVATPFVAALLMKNAGDDEVGQKGAIIQAAFLLGWAFGGAFFGRIGDLLGRRKALILTILTYACFTGLAALSQTWWQLMIFRFLAALGIGGEWAVGASLLVETWPKRWRPWIAAVLQCAVNIGILLACLAGYLFREDESNRYIFLIGILPALITLWIRKAVPETEEWEQAKGKVKPPGISELFKAKVWPVTWRVLLICSVSLTAHWAFMFWQQSYIRHLPEVASLSASEQNHAAAGALFWIMIGSLIGNFVAGGLALRMGYRKAIILMFVGYFICMYACFSQEWTHGAALIWFAFIGLFQGVFGLFTMCLPPLFPTLLRTTGAGFCYNFGRVVSAGGVILFGMMPKLGESASKAPAAGDALYYAGFLFIPAAIFAFLLPSEREDVDNY